LSEHPLDPIFHPRSVAIVGVSSREASRGARTSFLASVMDQGFQDHGALYPINPKLDELLGLTCYPSVLDCPGPVDHVISQIPAAGLPTLIAQCIEKGVRSIHLFTAGFSETGDPELARQEREIIAQARAGGIRIFGPNCMGLYVPEAHLSFQVGLPAEPGDVMVISQSGANAGDIAASLAERGMRFSKVVSYGNGTDVDSHELFDYAASDPDTSVVLAYIEGVKNGRAFFEAVKRCAAVKPTIILKGGLTSAGARAANSHTGSLAGSTDIFEALCRQAGAYRAPTMEDLQDMAIAITTSARNVRGRGVVLMGGGGGFSVLSADAIAQEGLDLPEMPQAVQDQLHEFVPVAGTSVRNPIDAGFLGRDGVNHRARALEIVASAPGIAAVFYSTGTPPGFGNRPAESGEPEDDDRRDRAKRLIEEIAGVQERTGTAVLSVRRGRGADEEAAREFLFEAYRRNVAVFPAVARAARTIGALQRWRARREGLPEIF